MADKTKELYLILNNKNEQFKTYAINQTDKICSNKCQLEVDEINHFNKRKSEKDNSNYLLSKINSQVNKSSKQIYSKENLDCFKKCVGKITQGYIISKEIYRHEEIRLLDIKKDDRALFYTFG